MHILLPVQAVVSFRMATTEYSIAHIFIIVNTFLLPNLNLFRIIVVRVETVRNKQIY